MDILHKIYSAFDMSKMEWFTFIPEWVIPDAVVLLLGVLTVGFIIRKERRPLPILLEMFCFIFLYAAVYENMATVMGWYGYGQSLLMVFNVPLSVPLIEALFVYSALRLAMKTRASGLARAALVGCLGTLADLTLDPLSLSQVHGGIGRWSWFIGLGDANIYGAPVYNYTGWFILCGYAAAMIMLGRRWYERSGYKPWVGYAYPPLCMLAALAVMVSPLSSLILWLGPFFQKGGWTEWLMLGLVFSALTAVLFSWRGRMREAVSWKEDYIAPVVFGVFYLTNLAFDVVGKRFDILLFSLPFIALNAIVFVLAFRRRAAVDD
ncbi:MAG: carotenoid biosynthesis protein [Oscillospiraceae bacterium]|jgi:hypothetical protein|nr:carotenoid biosynthesis protein [Oscillospiraceae bacterium]